MEAQRGRAIAAIVLGLLAYAIVVPLWWDFFTTPQSERDGGHTLLSFYLPVTAIFGIPGSLLLVLGLLVLLRPPGRR